MAALFFFASCLLATSLATSVSSGGASYTIQNTPTTGQSGAPTGLYGQPQPQPQAAATTGQAYGGQYQVQTKRADGTVEGQYGYQTDGANVQVTYTTGTGTTNTKPATKPLTGSSSSYTTTIGEVVTPELPAETKTGSATKTTTTTTGTTGTTTAKDKTPLENTPTTYVIGQGQPGHTIYKLPVAGIYPSQSASFGQGNPGFYYSAGTTNTFPVGTNTFPAGTNTFPAGTNTFPAGTNTNQVTPNKFFAIPPVGAPAFANQIPQAQHFTYAFSAPNAAPIPSNVYGFNAPFGFWNGRLPLPYTTTYSTFQQPAPFRQQQQHYFYGTAPGLINQFPSNQFVSSQFAGQQQQQYAATNPFPSRYYNLYYPQGNFHRYPTSIAA